VDAPSGPASKGRGKFWRPRSATPSLKRRIGISCRSAELEAFEDSCFLTARGSGSWSWSSRHSRAPHLARALSSGLLLGLPRPPVPMPVERLVGSTRKRDPQGPGRSRGKRSPGGRAGRRLSPAHYRRSDQPPTSGGIALVVRQMRWFRHRRIFARTLEIPERRSLVALVVVLVATRGIRVAHGLARGLPAELLPATPARHGREVNAADPDLQQAAGSSPSRSSQAGPLASKVPAAVRCRSPSHADPSLVEVTGVRGPCRRLLRNVATGRDQWLRSLPRFHRELRRLFRYSRGDTETPFDKARASRSAIA
jgi:hypothetical protein